MKIEWSPKFSVEVDKFDKLFSELNAKDTETLVKNMEYTDKWLTEHKGKPDKAYGDFFKSEGIESPTMTRAVRRR